MDPIAWCESCGEPLHEGDDYDFDPGGHHLGLPGLRGG